MFTRARELRVAAAVLALAGVVAIQAEPALVDAAMNGDLKAVRTLVRWRAVRSRFVEERCAASVPRLPQLSVPMWIWRDELYVRIV